MIKIKVLHAINIKFPKDKIKKTKIDCFANSSIKYFYGSFTNNKKTDNPQWNSEIVIKSIHAGTINFILYSSSFISKNVQLGTVDIDLYSFFNQEGKQIINNANEYIQFQFPISTQEASFLYLSFCYTEKVYQPIIFCDINKPILHFWITSSPQCEFDGSYSPIELEITQITRNYNISNIRSNEKWHYSHCDKFVSWRTTGVNFSETPVFVGSQFSQIYSFIVYKITNIFNFLILNVSNYEGKVTLNLIAEHYMPFKPIVDDSQIGMIKTIDINVEPNKKYAIPFYLLLTSAFEDNKYVYNLQIEPILFNDIIYNKPQIDQNQDLDDLEDHEINFHHEIIARAQEIIEPLQNSQISIINSIPYCKKVLLYKKLNKLGLHINPNIRIYVYKNIHNSDYSIYGYPFFFVIDKKSHQRCKDIESKLLKKPYYRFKSLEFHKQFDFAYNLFVDLNLNEIGGDKIIFFNMKLKVEFEYFSFGKYWISHFDGDQETLLFENYITGEKYGLSHKVILLKFDFVDNDWVISPINQYFKHKKDLKTKINFLLQD